MAGYKRAQSMRRLQDQYAKLPPEKQRALGYGTITKAEAPGTNKPPEPKPKPKPRPMRAEASANDLQQMKITAEARGTEEGNLTYGKERGLAGLRKKVSGY